MSLKQPESEDLHHKVPINISSDNYDGKKETWFERTFRFRNVNEFSTLYTRERSRIIKAQKEREEFEKYWSGVQVNCTCRNQSPPTTPAIPKSTREIPLKSLKLNRKRRFCDEIDEENIPASFPDDAITNFNEEKTQNDVNYSFTRPGTIREHPEKSTMDRQNLQYSSQNSCDGIYEEKAESFNILNIYDDGANAFNLLCEETLNFDDEYQLQSVNKNTIS